MKKLLALILCLPLLLRAETPAPAHYVNDFVGKMSASVKIELATNLQKVFMNGGPQIAIAIVSSLDGKSVEDYANNLFRTWGIGRKGKNDGVLLLIAPNERKIRIEVGSGLEGDLPDILCKQIITGIIAPNLKAGNYDAAVIGATNQIVTAVTPRAKPGERGEGFGEIPGWVWNALIVLVIVLLLSIHPFIKWRKRVEADRKIREAQEAKEQAERDRLDAIRMAEWDKQERIRRAQREKERLEEEARERAWRAAHPREAAEKDEAARIAAIAVAAALAAAALAEEERRRRRKREEEEESSRSSSSSSW